MKKLTLLIGFYFSIFLLYSAPMMEYIKMKNKPTPKIDWSLVLYTIIVLILCLLIILIWYLFKKDKE